MKYIPEPFKIKMVEPIRLTTEDERRQKIATADYNLFGLMAEDVYIDLLTDSGTGAMSDAQWAAMLRGDESYSGGRSYYQLVHTAREIFGYEWIQPVHQGRAAEKVLFPVLIERPGQCVISNTFFDTTRAHVGLAGGRPIDCISPEGLDSLHDAPFKGNMDLAALERHIADEGADNVAGIVMTITNNSIGGQPVSMANMKATAAIAQRHQIPLVIDAARYAENAFFIKQREPGYGTLTTRQITREFFSYADIFTMSAKKDAIANMGGLLGVREEGVHVPDVKSLVISSEGYVTYGGCLAAIWRRSRSAWTKGWGRTTCVIALVRWPTWPPGWTTTALPTSGQLGATRYSWTPANCYHRYRGINSLVRRWRLSCMSKPVSVAAISVRI